MMTISVDCPDCGKNFKVPDSLAGKKGRCKACGGAFTVPSTMEPVSQVDPFYDLETPLSPRQTASSSVVEDADDEVLPSRVTKAVKTRKARSQQAGDGETDPIYKWGFGLSIFAMVGFILPSFGLQFKLIGPLPPEAQLGVLILAFLIGNALLLGGKPASTFQRVAKYLWLGFMALLVMGFLVIMVLGVILVGQMGGMPQPAPQPQPQIQPQPQPQPSSPPTNLIPPPTARTGGPLRPLPVPPHPTGPRPPGSNPIFVGPTLFTVTSCRAAHKAGGKKADIEFQIDYRTIGEIPPGTVVYGVAESGRFKTNIPIRRVGTENGQVSWWSTLDESERGPFRFFLAIIYRGPEGKGWLQLSDAVEGIAVSGD